MARDARRAILFAAAAAVCSPGFSQQEQVRIHLEGGGHFSDKTLRSAQEIASHILASAGVRVLWTRDPNPSAPSLRFEIVLEAPNMLDGRPVDGKALGYTAPAPYTAAGIGPRIRAIANRLELDESLVLGAVLVHEVAHLLGVKKHSSNGIMGEELTLTEYLKAGQGSLRFNPSDADRMRQTLNQIR